MADTARLDGFAVRQGIEIVGAQEGALQELLRDPDLAKYTFTGIKVIKDKLTRALPVVARSEQGKFAVVRAPWNQQFIDELCAFPESTHDDQVDALSGAMTLLTLPTGAISDPSKIYLGSPTAKRAFTPRRLAATAMRM